MDFTHDLDAQIKIQHRLASHVKGASAIQGQIFLLIAQQGNCASKFLEDALGVNQSTISRETRSLRGLGDQRRKRRHLIRSYKDPQQPQRNRYELTVKGEKLAASIVKIQREAAMKNLQLSV